jgi:putative lipoic acid-binding regulatory protein
MKDIPPDQSLIDYPCQFPIKVMGLNVDGFTEAVVSIAAQFDPSFGPNAVQTRPSSGHKYLGVTITVTATSRAQLDELYRTLSTHPLVKMVL